MDIYQSIAAIQADVDFIGKEKRVQSGGSYNYRGVDQVLNTLHPLFSKHKVFAVPEVLEILSREERDTKNGWRMLYQVAKIKYTFYAEDGSSVSAVVLGEAMDSGDKASNKCMSVAYKYACFQILSIPTEETTQDPDDQQENLSPKKHANTKKTPPITEEEIASYGARDVKKMVAYIEDNLETELPDLDEEQKETVRHMLKAQKAKREAQQISPPWEDEEGE